MRKSFSIRLDPRTMHEVKIQAALQESSISSIIESALSKYLGVKNHE